MKLPMLDTRSALAPLMEALFAETDERESEPLSKREVVTELTLALLLLVACWAIAGFSTDFGHVDAGPAIVLTLTYALATRIRFYVGAAYTVPTQIVLMPMLFLLPHALVALFAAAGFVLGRLPDVARGQCHPDRLLTSAVNAWHVIGPAAVFAAAGIAGPDWDDAGWYVVAIAAQIAVDMVVSFVRFWFGLGMPALPSVAHARVVMVDILLTPVGLLAAFAAADAPYRVLLTLPLLAVFAIFAQEREANLKTALQLSSAYRGTALLLGDVLEDKDAYTASHSHGVVSLSLAVSDRMGLDPAARRRVEFGALLHDIGKIAVPAEIINKPGPLDEEEWAVMKLHTVEGQQMLDRIGGVLGEVGRVVRSSHEHYDGSGYPDGLAGADIPVESRIVSCCDAFSAMTTTRSYRKAMSLESAREELVRNSGTQFDPGVVDALLDVIGKEKVVLGPDALDVGPPAPAHSST
jgi:HD-GYP domain-containing protein (c-di-GMP phosphodiesterase class II)